MQCCTTKIHLKRLDEKELAKLLALERLSKQVYNYTIKIVDSYYKSKGRVPSKYCVIKELINSTAYKELGSDFKYVAYNATNDFNRSYYRTQNPPRPSKLTAIAFSPVIYNNCLMVPNCPELYFNIPKYLWGKNIVFAFILPTCDSYTDWELGIVYAVQEKQKLPKQACAAIDLGIENFATVVCNNGETMIIDGRRLKNILYFDYKKQHDNNYSSKDRARRNNKVNDYVKKSVKTAMEFLSKNNVTSLYIGTNVLNAELRTKWKVKSLWSDFLFSKFVTDISAKCKIAGIYVNDIDEAYTSVSSFIDGDSPPPHITGHKYVFSGKRKKRGLYVSKDGITINADVNGAFNIMVKGCLYLCNDFKHLQDNPKLIKAPKRIDPLRAGKQQ